jgi:hypothetical protein
MTRVCVCVINCMGIFTLLWQFDILMTRDCAVSPRTETCFRHIITAFTEKKTNLVNGKQFRIYLLVSILYVVLMWYADLQTFRITKLPQRHEWTEQGPDCYHHLPFAETDKNCTWKVTSVLICFYIGQKYTSHGTEFCIYAWPVIKHTDARSYFCH